MTTFNLPDLGEGLKEAEIVGWHVAVGDHVVADQPLVSVETDKAVVEIPAPSSGRIKALHGAPGDIVETGAALVELEPLGAVPDAGAVVGALDEAPAPAPRAPRPGPEPARGAARASPAVRALAVRLGVELAGLAGSGPGGSITRADVESAGSAAAAPVDPLRGVRRAMARNMARAHAEVVPATLTDTADIGAWSAAVDVTLRLARAIVAGASAEPALNAWYLGPDHGRRMNPHVDLGIAIDTPDGLFAPVLRNVGGRSADDLRRGLERMKADVRARTVGEHELRGATITLSNFGMLAGLHAALVVMPPQVAILGAGRIHERVVPWHGEPAIRRALPLSLTFDHRAVSGGEAARFMLGVIDDLARAD